MCNSDLPGHRSPLLLQCEVGGIRDHTGHVGLHTSASALGLAGIKEIGMAARGPNALGETSQAEVLWSRGPVGHRPSTDTEEDGKIVCKSYLVAYIKARGGSLWAGGDHVEETAVRQNIF